MAGCVDPKADLAYEYTIDGNYCRMMQSSPTYSSNKVAVVPLAVCFNYRRSRTDRVSGRA